MQKILLIGWKDLKLAFRDRAALMLMLAAPFLLTLGLGFVTGRFSGSSSRPSRASRSSIVNQDGGRLGNALVSTFQSPGPGGSGHSDPARRSDRGAPAGGCRQGRGGGHHPARLHRRHHPAAGATTTGEAVQIELYTNPTSPTSAGVIKTILEQFLSQVEVGQAGGQVAVTQMLQSRSDPASGHRLG